MHQELIKFIEEYLVKGFSRDEIRQILLKNGGWTNEDLDNAFKEVTIVSVQANESKNADKKIETTAPIKTPVDSLSKNNNEKLSDSNENKESLLSPRELLNKAWDIYKTKYKSILSILALPYIFSFLIVVLSPSKDLNPEEISAFLMALILVFGFLFFVTHFLSQLALFYFISKNEDNPSVIDSYRLGSKKTFSYLWIVFLSGSIIFGGMVFFFIPGIIFSIWFSLSLVIIFKQETRGLSALLLSREYIQGIGLKFFWRLVYVSVFMFVLSIGIYFISLPFEYIFSLISVDLLSRIFSFITNLIIQLLTVPLSILYMFLLFDDIRRIKGDKVQISSYKWPFIVISLFGLLFIPVLILGLVFLNYEIASIEDIQGIEKFMGASGAENKIIPSDISKDALEVSSE